MLDSAISSSTAANQSLMVIWAARYLPDLSSIPFYLRKLVFNKLADSISSANRQRVADSILSHLDTDCTFSGIEAQRLCLKAGQGLKIAEAKDLATHISRIYRLLLEQYVADFVFAPVLDSLYELDSQEGRLKAAARIVPGFNRLSQAMHPLLQQLQQLYIVCDNPQAIGFLTTQLHLTRQRVLTRLDVYGRMWLNSYLQQIEEQTCMPWQRINEAANQDNVNLTAVRMVQQMLPLSQTIADRVYQQAVLDFPHHISRQGRIQTAAVQASSTRDLSMFQAYIWLSVLEGNVSVVEQELLPLCLLVFPALDVRWFFVEQGVEWILEAVGQRLNPEQKRIFDPIGSQVLRLFASTNPAVVDAIALGERIHLRAALSHIC
jgi:hypothetical protein